jgi:hypothetical protein
MALDDPSQAQENVQMRLQALEQALGRLLSRDVLFLGSFATAVRPSPTSVPGALIYCSDAAAGAKLQYSDGTNWVAAG